MLMYEDDTDVDNDDDDIDFTKPVGESVKLCRETIEMTREEVIYVEQ